MGIEGDEALERYSVKRLNRYNGGGEPDETQAGKEIAIVEKAAYPG
jgi:hypothetical protein